MARKQLIICKLTGAEGKGVKAHVIPKSFNGIDPEEKLPLRVITNAEGRYGQNIPTGIYDTTILIEEGERVFSEWDDYAKELLIDRQNEIEEIRLRNQIPAFVLPKYNYAKLKLFCLSVLWRASVSSQSMFQGVKLGPHEAKIRSMLLAGDPGSSDWYAVILSKWTGIDMPPGMLSPHTTKFDGVNYYLLFIGGYICYCCVFRRT